MVCSGAVLWCSKRNCVLYPVPYFHAKQSWWWCLLMPSPASSLSSSATWINSVLVPSVVAADHLKCPHNDCQEHHHHPCHNDMCLVKQGNSQEAGWLFSSVGEQRWKLSDGWGRHSQRCSTESTNVHQEEENCTCKRLSEISQSKIRTKIKRSLHFKREQMNSCQNGHGHSTWYVHHVFCI